MSQDRIGKQETALLLIYVILLSLTLMNLSVPAGNGFWISAMLAGVFFAGIVMLDQWKLPDEKRVGQSAFLAFLVLMGLLIITDLVLYFLNPFEGRRQ